MGSRRLPRPQALIALLAAAGIVFAAGCRSDGATRAEEPTPSPVATEAPTPTATPDPLGPAPANAEAAIRGLERLLAATPGDPCPEALKRAWAVTCATGDLDGDGRPDTAYLVPIVPTGGVSPNPAVVLVRRSSGPGNERLPANLEADHSVFGRSLFAVADRTGDAQPELTFLTNECGARACSTRVFVEQWDGTAWRDLGPGPGIDNIDRIIVEGQGAKSIITVHGGAVTGPGAGPSRASTYSYAFESGRYQPRSIVADPPVYLYHAIVDADAKFDVADWVAAVQAYQAAIDNKDLKDWRQEAGRGESRTFLSAYALFRIAVATAASGQKPDAALDAVILTSKEELFVNAALAFRRGLQERGGVHPGCLDATTYLSDPAAAAYIRDHFDHGYANFPVKTFKDICPL